MPTVRLMYVHVLYVCMTCIYTYGITPTVESKETTDMYVHMHVCVSFMYVGMYVCIDMYLTCWPLTHEQHTARDTSFDSR